MKRPFTIVCAAAGGGMIESVVRISKLLTPVGVSQRNSKYHTLILF